MMPAVKATRLTFNQRGFFVIFTTAFLFWPLLLPEARAQLGSETVYRFVYAIYQNDTNTAWHMLESNTNLAYCKYGGDMGGDILPLLEAAAAGNFELVKRLLELGVDVNAEGRIWMGGSHMTALDEAARNGHLEVCKLLLAAGGNPNHRGFQDTTLHLAFNNGMFKTNRNAIADALLEYGANPFVEVGYYKNTPFEYAITRSDGRLVSLMLDTDRKIKSAPTAPHRSSAKNNTVTSKMQAAEFLATHGPAMLSAAAQRGELEAVQALLKAGVPVKAIAPEDMPVLQSFAIAEAAAVKEWPPAVAQWQQCSNELKNLGTNANPQHLASIISREAELSARVESSSPERWRKIRDLLIKNGASYDVFAATAMADIAQINRLLAADKNVVQARDRDGQTPLHWAVSQNQLPLTSFWIQTGASLGQTNFSGQTPMHLAAAKGFVDQIKILLAANAPTGIRDTNGLTPLDAAIHAQQSDCIHLLMAKAPTAEHPERGLATTLHKAAADGNVSALAALLETETNLEARNELGLTPLHVAGEAGQLGAAALLIDHGADVNARDPDGNTVLHRILLSRTHWVKGRPSGAWVESRKKNPSEVKFWQVYSTPSGYTSPRELAASVAFFLACGTDPAATNHAGQTILQLVTADSTMLWDYDRAAILPLLQQSGNGLDERDADGNTALHRLCTGAYDISKAEKMAALIESGADINATNNLGQTPLHIACEKIWGWSHNDPPDGEPFQLLVYKKANVNARDNQGRTPMDVLIASASSFKSEAMALLIQAGAKSNDTDKKGLTPVHQTLTGKWPWESAGENLQQLAKAGADFSAKDKDGKTPLHYLAALGSEKPMFFIRGIDNTFADAKVDFNARDNEGNTPLIIAVKTGTMDVFDWLVQQGADLDATNNVGETPRMLALRQNNQTSRLRMGTQSAELDVFQAIREGKDISVERILIADPQLVNTPDRSGQTPLRLAVTLNRTNIISLLDSRGAKWDAPSAVMAGRADLLKKMLKDQPTAITESANGESLLHLAATSGNVDIIKQLLAATADLQAVDSFGLSALGRARLNSQTEAINLLVAHGSTNNYFDAIYLNDVTSVSGFLSRDKSLANATNQAGVTPVEIATAADFTQMLQLLLKAGGRANAIPAPPGTNPPSSFAFNRPLRGMFPFNRTETPLNLAVFHNRTNAVDMLIRAGADVNQADSSGFAPLHFAVLRNDLQVLSLLLQHKANPNAASAQLFSGPRMLGPRRFDMAPVDSQPLIGETPLHLAAMLGKTNLIELLLKSGANVNATNGWSRTPLDEAEMTGRSFRMSITPPAMMKPLEPLGLFQEQVFVSSVSPENLKGTAAMIAAAGGKHGAVFESHAARISHPPLSTFADGTEYHNRGCSDFNAHNFTNALADFRKSAELGSDYQDYTYFRIWIIRSRLGEKEAATRELAAYLDHRKISDANDWPLQVGRFLAGQSTESNFLATADSPNPQKAKEQHCEANFYIGSKRLVEGDKLGAIDFFQKCKDSNLTDFEEYQSATSELGN
jgi:ankyrin repeat protein